MPPGFRERTWYFRSVCEDVLPITPGISTGGFPKGPPRYQVRKSRDHLSRLSLPFHPSTSPLAQGFNITTSPNTALWALHGAKELGLTKRFNWVPLTGTQNIWVFVYRRSSGVAIQLSKLPGYQVVIVASGTGSVRYLRQ